MAEKADNSKREPTNMETTNSASPVKMPLRDARSGRPGASASSEGGPDNRGSAGKVSADTDSGQERTSD